MFPSQGHCLKLLEGDSLQLLANDIGHSIVAEYFKTVCWKWMKKNYGDYYWDEIREGFPKAEFQKIETVTTKSRPFYENICFLFLAGRACNYVEQLRNLDTVAVVDLKSLLGQKNKELF